MTDLVSELVSRFRWIDGHADIWPLFADARLFQRVAGALADPFRRDSISKVAGIEARGFILGAAVALELRSGFVAVRKPGGLLPGPKRASTTHRDYRGAQTELRLQEQSLDAGDRVLLVDDWCETGSQALTARELIESTGSSFVGVSVIVDQLVAHARPRLSRFEALVEYDAFPPGGD